MVHLGCTVTRQGASRVHLRGIKGARQVRLECIYGAFRVCRGISH